ncbi:MAG: hypothetical protein AAB343_03320 [Patescibacteria group bacterium]
MSKVNRSKRASAITLKRQRRKKIAVLKSRISKTKSVEEKKRLEAKILVMSPEYFNTKK